MPTIRINCALGTLALIGALSPSLLTAKTSLATWDRLDRLHEGQKVEVLKKNSEMVTGSFVIFTSESVALRVRDEDVKIDRADVQEVRLSSGDNRLKHALIGAAVGAAVGGVMFAAVNRAGSSAASTAGYATLVMAVPAFIGAMGPYSVVYRADR